MDVIISPALVSIVIQCLNVWKLRNNLSPAGQYHRASMDNCDMWWYTEYSTFPDISRSLFSK